MTEAILSFFSGLSEYPIVRMRMLTGGLLFFWILERSISFLPMFYKTTKARHMVVNPGFTAMHLFIHSFFALFILLSYY